MSYPTLFAIPHGIRLVLFWFVFVTEVRKIRVLWFGHLAQYPFLFFGHFFHALVVFVASGMFDIRLFEQEPLPSFLFTCQVNFLSCLYFCKQFGRLITLGVVLPGCT